MAIGVDYAQEYIGRFGFGPKQHPAYSDHGAGRWCGDACRWPRATGVCQWRLRACALYLIDRIEDDQGRVVVRAHRGWQKNAEQTIDPRNAFIATSMMKDVCLITPPCAP